MEKLGPHRMILSEKTISRHAGTSSIPEKTVIPIRKGALLEVNTSRAARIEKSEIVVSKDFFERRFFGANNKLANVWQFNSGLWNQFNVLKRVVVIRNADQLPGIRPIDLQATSRFGESLDRFLVRSKIKQAIRQDVSEFGAGTIQVILSNDSGGSTTELIFAASKRFMPVRYKEVLSNGTVVVDRNFEYETVTGRDALIVRKIVSTFDIDSSITNPDFRRIAFQGVVTLAVDKYELVDEPTVQQKRMEWDREWIVQDLTKWNVKRKQLDRFGNGYLLHVVVISMFGIGLVVLVRRLLLR